MRRQMRQTAQARRSSGPYGRRRGTAIVASAAALCLGGGLLTGCGGGPGDDGYVAVGAVGSGPARSGSTGPPGKVTLVPLDGGGGTEDDGGGGAAGDGPGPGSPPSSAHAPDTADGLTGRPAARPDGSGPTGGGSGSRARTEAPGASGTGITPGGAPAATRPAASSKPSKPGSGSTPSTPGSPKPGGGGGTTSPPPPTEPAPPPTPAALQLSAPQRAPADKRWCEKVTVEFRNTGGSPARSGTIAFATHIIGALGVDWATIRSSQSLPTPIAGGATRSETYTVCVESWRVPLGMRVETQDVSAVWE
ncbi:hypothetical protein ACFC3O_25795 [Streptomyces sp. NPDC056007]|uniref:hypothetical protein n=1 Tax=Streptomyces sp. NPDC056007 TaxID=3345678 RepID=UPI0035DE200C